MTSLNRPARLARAYPNPERAILLCRMDGDSRMGRTASYRLVIRRQLCHWVCFALWNGAEMNKYHITLESGFRSSTVADFPHLPRVYPHSIHPQCVHGENPAFCRAYCLCLECRRDRDSGLTIIRHTRGLTDENRSLSPYSLASREIIKTVKQCSPPLQMKPE